MYCMLEPLCFSLPWPSEVLWWCDELWGKSCHHWWLLQPGSYIPLSPTWRCLSFWVAESWDNCGWKELLRDHLVQISAPSSGFSQVACSLTLLRPLPASSPERLNSRLCLYPAPLPREKVSAPGQPTGWFPFVGDGDTRMDDLPLWEQWFAKGGMDAWKAAKPYLAQSTYLL